MRDLLAGDCDLALAGGAQVWMPVATLNLFCRLGALSRREQLRAFDKDADGTLLGEGIGAVVLKRAEDAVRDGDRVYAVIRGVGVSSDGRGMSVMAPRIEGEELALRRAYEAAGVSPTSVGLLEAHGTGTPVGDVDRGAGADARVRRARRASCRACALGTVKSMIGHTIPAAGVAGLIKTALALHHRVLPPTLACEEPNPELELEQTAVLHQHRDAALDPRRRRAAAGRRQRVRLRRHQRPRRARGMERAIRAPPTARRGTARSCILEADSQQALLEHGRRADGGDSSAIDRARARRPRVHAQPGARAATPRPRRLAVVSASLEDLRKKLGQAIEKLPDPDCARIKTTSGIYYEAEPLGREGKVVFVFPGEGAQYPNMLADLCLQFPEARAVFDRIDRLYADHPRGHLLSDWVFPRPAFSDAERQRTEARLMELDIAVEAVLTAPTPPCTR